jgi:outer membrane protein W
MLRNALKTASLALALLVVVPTAARADQLFNVNLGYFAVRGEDARNASDVLVANRSFLNFDIKDFNNAFVGGEWLAGIGDFVEAGVGVGYYGRTVPSTYLDFTNANGSEIEQDLKLRIVPITATIRYLPLGRHAAVQPYIGGGLGLYSWRFSETGEFVDFSDSSIFRASFRGSGVSAGPVVLGGLRVPVGSSFGVGGEIRYQRGEGTLGSDFQNQKIDLTGYTYQATFSFRF